MATVRLTKKKKIEVLTAALALIKVPNGWGKKSDRDADPGGKRNKYQQTDGPCYCARGAVMQACLELGLTKSFYANSDEDGRIVYGLVDELTDTLNADAVKYASIITFNDNYRTTKKDVVGLFEKTIARLAA